MMITFRDIFSDLEIFFIFVHFIMKSKGMVQTFVSKHLPDIILSFASIQTRIMTMFLILIDEALPSTHDCTFSLPCTIM